MAHSHDLTGGATYAPQGREADGGVERAPAASHARKEALRQMLMDRVGALRLWCAYAVEGAAEDYVVPGCLTGRYLVIEDRAEPPIARSAEQIKKCKPSSVVQAGAHVDSAPNGDRSRGDVKDRGAEAMVLPPSPGAEGEERRAAPARAQLVHWEICSAVCNDWRTGEKREAERKQLAEVRVDRR